MEQEIKGLCFIYHLNIKNILCLKMKPCKKKKKN